MKSLEIITPGLLSSIQDLGRKGYCYYAIPCSGALDRSSLVKANRILGNPDDAACIEFNFLPASIRFFDQCRICLSGADMAFYLNDVKIPMDTLINVDSGDLLSGSWALSNARSYLAFDGPLELKKVYGSCSAMINLSDRSAFGSTLKKGEILKWDSSKIKNLGVPDSKTLSTKSVINIFKGPEWSLIGPDAIHRISTMEFSLSSKSNRMGARLNELVYSENYCPLKYSVPVLKGFIQWTPSGELIVLLQDGQTTGGYPRIAYIKEEDLSDFNQIGFSYKFRFEIHQ